MPSMIASTMSRTTGRRAALISAGRYNHGGSDGVWAMAHTWILSRHHSFLRQRVRLGPRYGGFGGRSWCHGPDQVAPARGVDPDDPAGARGRARPDQPAVLVTAA